MSKPTPKIDLRYVFTRGHLKLTITDAKGKITQEGGFYENWRKGDLWFFIDLRENRVVDASFNIKDLEKRALDHITEKKKTNQTEMS